MGAEGLDQRSDWGVRGAGSEVPLGVRGAGSEVPLGWRGAGSEGPIGGVGSEVPDGALRRCSPELCPAVGAGGSAAWRTLPPPRGTGSATRYAARTGTCYTSRSAPGTGRTSSCATLCSKQTGSTEGEREKEVFTPTLTKLTSFNS